MDRLRKTVDASSTINMSWHGLPDTSLISVIAKQNFDACLLDMQHGLHDEASVIAGVAAIAAAGKSPLVRVPVQRWDMVERAFDFGALGVVAPMINTKEDAQRFAEAAKYPPMGSRSYGPTKAAEVYNANAANLVSAANHNNIALAMIETEQAFANLDEILAVEGIDGILLGPGDFSISVRQNPVPDVYGPDTIDQIAEMAKRTNAAGKISCAFTMNSKDYKVAKSLGFKIISIGTDVTYATTGVQSLLGEAE